MKSRCLLLKVKLNLDLGLSPRSRSRCRLYAHCIDIIYLRQHSDVNEDVKKNELVLTVSFCVGLVVVAGCGSYLGMY